MNSYIRPYHLNNYKYSNNANEDLIADPLPFDYGDLIQLEGKDIMNITNSVLNDEHQLRMIRRLPDPKPLKEDCTNRNHNGIVQLQHSYYTSPFNLNATATTLEHLLDRPSTFQYPFPYHHSPECPSNTTTNNNNTSTNNNSNLQSVTHNNNSSLVYPNHNLLRKDGIYQLPNLHLPPGFLDPQPQQYYNQQQQSISSDINKLKSPTAFLDPQQQQQQQLFRQPPQPPDLIKIKTSLKPKYWRNGRRNLQCFPSCKVFGDYSYIRLENLKQHDFMWGKCRGSIEVEVPIPQHTNGNSINLLARIHSLENLPVSFEDAAMRECMSGRIVAVDIMEIMKETWIVGDRLSLFTDTNTATFEFKPKVWKYVDDVAHGKCKRRNVRYYLQVEAFVPCMHGNIRSFLCVGSGRSTSFEVGSSRVLARQKRKAATISNEETTQEENPAKVSRVEPVYS